MVRFLDGPAAGIILCLRRAPLVLRAVRGKEWDALDQLGDKPEPGEAVYAYRRVGEPGWVHVDGRDKKGRRFGQWFRTGDYRLIDPQPDDGTLRDTVRWQAWAAEQHQKDQANV